MKCVNGIREENTNIYIKLATNSGSKLRSFKLCFSDVAEKLVFIPISGHHV